MMKTLLLLFISFITYYSAIAQSGYLRGKVQEKGYDKVIASATVKNLKQENISESDMGGNYRIFVSIGDKITFSSVGYTADTVVVKENMLNIPYDIFLVRNVIELSKVTVGELNSYQVDSISRQQEFEDVLSKKNGKLVGGKGNTISDGVGVTLSPLSYFSQKEKNERRFKKMFARQEEELYVDYRFSHDYISEITHLQGDSLQKFMYNYRPDYKFCRKASKTDMLTYINDSYMDFTHQKGFPPKKKKKKKS